MEILKTDPSKPEEQIVNKIVESLNKGSIVILPTETVYTFAVDATNEKAVKTVYEIKQRDFSKPMHVVVSSLEKAEEYVYVNKEAEKLAKAFLPGPLTIILNKKQPSGSQPFFEPETFRTAGLGRTPTLPDILTSGLPTLGIRIPNMALILEVARIFRKPFTTTSANVSGGENPYTIDDVLEQLTQKTRNKIDLAVDVGKLPKVNPSTIVDLTKQPYAILREGPITKKEIDTVLKTRALSQ